jgi:hypothetical protein
MFISQQGVKVGNVKDSFYGELECVFDTFCKYHMTILLGDFSAKVDKEGIFKLTIGNQSLDKISDDNGTGVVHFDVSKISQSNKQCSHIATFTYIL